MLTIAANPTQIGLNGGTSQLTVTGFKPDGNPLNPGTQITLSTDLGVLSSNLIEADGNGRATATLRSDGQPGPAMVTATPASGGDASATVTVTIGQTDTSRQRISLTVSPSVLGLGERATVTGVARNSDNTLFGAGGEVLFRTDLGFFSSGGCGSGGPNSITVTTNSNSEARTFLCAGQQPGTANLTGSFGSSDDAMATVTIENQRPNLIINANPDNISTAETSVITVIARDENDVPLGAGFQIQLLSSFGLLDPETPETDDSGRATSVFDPNGDFGDAQIQAFLGSSETVTVNITVRGDVVAVEFSTIPGTIQDSDQEIRLVARALDSRNEGVSSVIARFTAQLGNGTNVGRFEEPGGEVSSDGSVLTDNNGQAIIDLDILETEVAPGDVITVLVTVNTESGSVTSPPGRITVQ
ncbi:MAG: Ig-like domain-containing protein [Acidobacteriota bacterium]